MEINRIDELSKPISNIERDIITSSFFATYKYICEFIGESINLARINKRIKFTQYYYKMTYNMMGGVTISVFDKSDDTELCEPLTVSFLIFNESPKVLSELYISDWRKKEDWLIVKKH